MLSPTVQNQIPALAPQKTLQMLHDAKTQKVAQEFESIFTTMMLKNMRSSLDGLTSDNDFLPTSTGEKIYTQMLDEQYGQITAKQGSLGIAAMILKQLQKEDADTSGSSLNMLKGLNTPSWMIDNKFIPTTSSSSAHSSASASNITQWMSSITSASKEYNVDPSLICAVITQESGGNAQAVSAKGAKGLMQLMDSTAKDIGVSQPFNGHDNIMGGTKYLRQMLDKCSQNEQLALAAYNAGPAAVERFNGIPPYPETQQYVKSVQSLKQRFCQTLFAPQTLAKENDLGNAH